MILGPHHMYASAQFIQNMKDTKMPLLWNRNVKISEPNVSLPFLTTDRLNVNESVIERKEGVDLEITKQDFFSHFPPSLLSLPSIRNCHLDPPPPINPQQPLFLWSTAQVPFQAFFHGTKHLNKSS